MSCASWSLICANPVDVTGSVVMPTKVKGKGKNRRVVVMPYRTSKKKKKVAGR